MVNSNEKWTGKKKNKLPVLEVHFMWNARMHSIDIQFRRKVNLKKNDRIKCSWFQSTWNQLVENYRRATHKKFVFHLHWFSMVYSFLQLFVNGESSATKIFSKSKRKRHWSHLASMIKHCKRIIYPLAILFIKRFFVNKVDVSSKSAYSSREKKTIT